MRHLIISFFLVFLSLTVYAKNTKYDEAGSVCVQGNYQQDLQNLMQLATKQNDAKAQYKLGCMYANGQGVKHDDSEAIHWFRLAAELGDSSAQYNLGIGYAN